VVKKLASINKATGWIFNAEKTTFLKTENSTITGGDSIYQYQ
jgi:hypothetical protein